jgi:hypothetical protein
MEVPRGGGMARQATKRGKARRGEMRLKGGLIRFVLAPLFFLVGLGGAYTTACYPEEDLKLFGSVQAAQACVTLVLSILGLAGGFGAFYPRVGRLLLLVACLAVSLLVWVVQMPGGRLAEKAFGSALFVFLGVWLYRELGPEHARKA